MILDMQQHALGVAGYHHVVGPGAGLEPGSDQLRSEVDGVAAVAETVVGHDHDVGGRSEAEPSEPLEANADYYVRVRLRMSPRRTFSIWPFGRDDGSGRKDFTFIR